MSSHRERLNYLSTVLERPIDSYGDQVLVHLEAGSFTHQRLRLDRNTLTPPLAILNPSLNSQTVDSSTGLTYNSSLAEALQITYPLPASLPTNPQRIVDLANTLQKTTHNLICYQNNLPARLTLRGLQPHSDELTNIPESLLLNSTLEITNLLLGIFHQKSVYDLNSIIPPIHHQLSHQLYLYSATTPLHLLAADALKIGFHPELLTLTPIDQEGVVNYLEGYPNCFCSPTADLTEYAEAFPQYCKTPLVLHPAASELNHALAESLLFKCNKFRLPLRTMPTVQLLNRRIMTGFTKLREQHILSPEQYQALFAPIFETTSSNLSHYPYLK
jgi:hypothetical protein